MLYKRSTDRGSFTEPIKNLTFNSGGSFDPVITVSGNNVHVVWQDDTPGNDDIFYRRSTNSGATFPAVMTNLSTNTGESANPKIAGT